MAFPDMPPRLPLAQLQTPLEYLDRISANIGSHRIWIKRDDLTGCATSGNKIRKLEFLSARAQQLGCKTLISCGGIQSNHCRTTALAASRLGMECSLVLRLEGTDYDPQALDGNLLLAGLCGARIHLLSEADYQRDSESLMESLAAETGGYIIPTGGSNPVGVWGYVQACRELADDCRRAGIGGTPHIVHATGSGGTQAGLIAGAMLAQFDSRIWGVNVCESATWFIDKIRQDLALWCDEFEQDRRVLEAEINILEGYIGPGYARADKAVYQTLKELANLHGIILDPVYTGKAFQGLLAEIGKGTFGPGGDIIFIHTGGIFGNFPHPHRHFLTAQSP